MLLAKLQHSQQPILWLIDEQTDVSQAASLSNKTHIICLSQRIDQVEALQALGFEAILSDYDFSNLAGKTFNTVALRLSKQKALVHHCFNQIPSVLTDDGQLVIAGAKNEGVKNFAKSLAKLSQSTSRERGKQQNELHSFVTPQWPNTKFDNSDYATLRPSIEYNGTRLFSKPGLFGWQKLDLGSRLLIDTLPEQAINADQTVLDLGCGYGLLAVEAAKRGGIVTATDNNIAATKTCQQNLKPFGDKHRAITADCAQGIHETFDVVLCNPPFHTGFEVDNNLTQRFAKAAAHRLKPSGTAYFVVNQFVPLERCAENIFSRIDLIAKDQGFKVFKLSQ